MNNQDFSLYLRNGVYYVQFKDSVTGLPGIQRSTKKKNQKDAYRVVIEWMTNGFSKYEESATQVIQNDIAINSVVLCTLAELVENACLFFLSAFWYRLVVALANSWRVFMVISLCLPMSKILTGLDLTYEATISVGLE